MNDRYIFGQYPFFVNACALPEQENGDKKSVRFFINDLEDWNRGKPKVLQLETSYVKLVFPVGESETDFFSKRSDQKLEARSTDWSIEKQSLSDDEKQYEIIFSPKLTREAAEEGDIGIFSASLSPFYPNGKKGISEIQMEISIDGESPAAGKVYLEKRDEGAVIESFYSEDSCVFKGQKTVLHWKVSNASEVSLEIEGEKTKPHLPPEDTLEVTADRNKRCTLTASESVKSTVYIQVMPVRLERFELHPEEKELVWDVYGQEQNDIRVDGISRQPHGQISTEALEKDKVYHLEAFGGGRKIDSWLTSQKEVSSGNQAPKNPLYAVETFRKTITDFGDYQILNVTWKTAGFKEIKLICQDYERGTVFLAAGKKSLPLSGDWEQLLSGTCIRVTLEAVKQDGTSCHFTI